MAPGAAYALTCCWCEALQHCLWDMALPGMPPLAREVENVRHVQGLDVRTSAAAPVEVVEVAVAGAEVGVVVLALPLLAVRVQLLVQVVAVLLAAVEVLLKQLTERLRRLCTTNASVSASVLQSRTLYRPLAPEPVCSACMLPLEGYQRG